VARAAAETAIEKIHLMFNQLGQAISEQVAKVRYKLTSSLDACCSHDATNTMKAQRVSGWTQPDSLATLVGLQHSHIKHGSETGAARGLQRRLWLLALPLQQCSQTEVTL
jgi:hypothetical protein